jgi:hypothetical protein
MVMSVMRFLLLLAFGRAVVFGMWWDQEHPFPVKVIRNSGVGLSACSRL